MVERIISTTHTSGRVSTVSHFCPNQMSLCRTVSKKIRSLSRACSKDRGRIGLSRRSSTYWSSKVLGWSSNIFKNIPLKSLLAGDSCCLYALHTLGHSSCQRISVISHPVKGCSLSLPGWQSLQEILLRFPSAYTLPHCQPFSYIFIHCKTLSLMIIPLHTRFSCSFQFSWKLVAWS